MARPLKEGLDYFSFDVDFFENRKVKKVMRACGPASAAVLSCLLCNIYRWKGYYILWDQDLPFDIADQVGMSEGAVTEIITKSVQVGFFDKEQLTKNNILTSGEIQDRWRRVAKDSGRNQTEVLAQYYVKSGFPAQETQLSAQKTRFSPQETIQSKVKESKIKKSRDPAHSSAKVFYDAEKLVLENQIEFERICCAAPKNFTVEKVKDVLRNYHLYLEERSRYPMTRRQIIAGFERWILNEKNFTHAGQRTTGQFTGNNQGGKKGTSDARIDVAEQF